MEIAVCKLDEIRADQSVEFCEPALRPQWRHAIASLNVHPSNTTSRKQVILTIGRLWDSARLYPGRHFNKAIRGKGQDHAGTYGGNLCRNAVQPYGPSQEDVHRKVPEVERVGTFSDPHCAGV